MIVLKEVLPVAEFTDFCMLCKEPFSDIIVCCCDSQHLLEGETIIHHNGRCKTCCKHEQIPTRLA